MGKLHVKIKMPLAVVVYYGIEKHNEDEWGLCMQDRKYQKKRQMVEKFIRKRKTTDYSVILNEVDVDYDTLMKILSELRNKGNLQ